MIHLLNVTKVAVDSEKMLQVALQNVSLTVPTDRTICMTCPDRTLASEVIGLISGCSTPDSGRIITEKTRLSPIVNHGGKPAGSLVPTLSAIENITFYSRVHGVPPEAILRLVEEAHPFGQLMKLPVRTLNWPLRRTLEASIVAALPFDCYFVDRMEDLDAESRARLAGVARLRGAGLIYTTKSPKIANQADLRLRIMHGNVTLSGAKRPVRIGNAE